MMLHESSKVWFDLACMSCLYVFILVFIVDSCGIVVCFMEFSSGVFVTSLRPLRPLRPLSSGPLTFKAAISSSKSQLPNVTTINNGNAHGPHGTQTASSISSGLATSQKGPKRFLGRNRRNVNMN